MSTTQRKRKQPLVYTAGARVLEDARQIVGADVVIENLVAAAIEGGHVTYGHDPKVVDPDGRWQAHVRRGRGQLRRTPRAWFVVALEPLPKEEPCP